MDILWLVFGVAGVVFLAFSFVVAYGAPYLPTLKPQIKVALGLAGLKPGQRLVELGSGDGRVVLAAAKQGIHVVGYELNPLLVLFSWLVTWHYRDRVRIIWGNFWRHKLPEADAIFTFLLPKYMSRLDTKVIQEAQKPTKLVSFAFQIPGKLPKTETQGVFLYEYE